MQTQFRICMFGALLSLAACSAPFPVRPGEALTYSRAEASIKPDNEDFDKTLQIRWLGTACHVIQVGPAAILTDPYFSHYGPFRVVFGDTPTDAATVAEKTQYLPKPAAVFIGHAHYDHLLDLAELRRQKQWLDVPIIGGPTVGHVLAGYHEGIEEDHKTPCPEGEWCRIGDGIEYMAFPARHAPHFLGTTFFPGTLEGPRRTPPNRARDFPLGEPHTYLFKLKYGPSDRESFTVFFAGAATDADCGIPDLPEGVDAAILCTPSWRNVRDYPDGVIKRLRPRVLILSHLDNFLQDGWKKREMVASAHLKGFLKKAREASTHDSFERIVITDMGTSVLIEPR